MLREFTKGIIKENPVLVLALGLCPALAVTTTAYNGIGMGIAASFVLIMSNIIISMIKRTVPTKIRIPIFITVIATFVTIVKLVMAGYTPQLSKQLGIFIPLIVVNCIILGRAEAFASKNGLLASILDGIGMGLGFSLALFFMGAVREIIGSGTITLGFPILIEPTTFNLMGKGFNPALLMILPPGGFLTLGVFMWIKQIITGE
ncbi:electron transport complex subunit RsxE [bacterium]|nr:MAG: electron transport complex subunit RsxE [bacterium]